MPTNNLIRQLPMAGRANFLPYQIGADGKPQLALPGILAGVVNAVTAPYRAMNPQNYPDFNTEQEAADFALNMMGGCTVFGRAPKNALGMNVWHGSPHKFEPTELNDLGEFNAAKIGTGEGAQAYSHGHYTGEARGTGEGYMTGGGGLQKAVTTPNVMIDGKWSQSMPRSSVESQAATAFANDLFGATIPQKVAKLRAANMDGVADFLEQNANKFQLSKGYLYKVDIPDEHIAQMLDWDKPLSEQTKALDALNKNKDFAQYVERITERPLSELDGKTLQRMAIGYSADKGTGGASGAAELFKGAGIPGVRYLDAGSRGAEGGTSNFVVFPGNENMMTILERNGQAMSPESQAIARYREVKGPKSVVRMEAALRTAGVPLPKSEPVAYIQGLVDRAHKRN